VEPDAGACCGKLRGSGDPVWTLAHKRLFRLRRKMARVPGPSESRAIGSRARETGECQEAARLVRAAEPCCPHHCRLCSPELSRQAFDPGKILSQRQGVAGAPQCQLRLVSRGGAKVRIPQPGQ